MQTRSESEALKYLDLFFIFGLLYGVLIGTIEHVSKIVIIIFIFTILETCSIVPHIYKLYTLDI